MAACPNGLDALAVGRANGTLGCTRPTARSESTVCTQCGLVSASPRLAACVLTNGLPVARASTRDVFGWGKYGGLRCWRLWRSQRKVAQRARAIGRAASSSNDNERS